MTADARPRAATGMPWLGLLLWAFACAALFVSLIMRPGDSDRDRRLAAHSEPRAPISDNSYRVRDLTRHASEISLFTGRHTRPH
jgi:hypothetical protein